jgi:cytochrome c-type biogenesis protein CcmH/NrfG
MIWVLGICLGLSVGLYLTAPFLAAKMDVGTSPEINAYRDELRALEQSEDPDAAKIAELKARLLKAAKAETAHTGGRSVGIAGGITLCLLGASLGLYGALGSPNFTPEMRQAPPAAPSSDGTDYAALLPRFEARLAENPKDATGWTLYGRTLMLSGDIPAGLRAYERALELTDTPEIRREYEAAQKFAQQVQSGPDPDTIAAMQNLSEADRTAAIEGMVESLRARLETEPNNPEGWTRLLRSRKVLGQEAAAQADMKRLREVLPDQAEEIISQSGWGN